MNQDLQPRVQSGTKTENITAERRSPASPRDGLGVKVRKDSSASAQKVASKQRYGMSGSKGEGNEMRSHEMLQKKRNSSRQMLPSPFEKGFARGSTSPTPFDLRSAILNRPRAQKVESKMVHGMRGNKREGIVYEERSQNIILRKRSPSKQVMHAPVEKGFVRRSTSPSPLDLHGVKVNEEFRTRAQKMESRMANGGSKREGIMTEKESEDIIVRKLNHSKHIMNFPSDKRVTSSSSTSPRDDVGVKVNPDLALSAQSISNRLGNVMRREATIMEERSKEIIQIKHKSSMQPQCTYYEKVYNWATASVTPEDDPDDKVNEEFRTRAQKVESRMANGGSKREGIMTEKQSEDIIVRKLNHSNHIMNFPSEERVTRSSSTSPRDDVIWHAVQNMILVGIALVIFDVLVNEYCCGMDVTGWFV